MTAPAVDTRPFAPFEWLLAMRYLRARRKEGFISVIAGFSFAGILLGVATLIIVMAVMNGFRKELFAKILGLDGHVVVIRVDNADFPDYNEYARKLEAAPTVKRAVPLIEGQVLASTAFMAVGAKVRGISVDGLNALPLIANNVKLGTLDGFDDRTDSIAVGIGFMRLLRINVGDTITLTSPRGARTPFGTVPRTKSYKVAAMFEMGMSALRFVDWRERNAGFFSVLQVERNMMFIILSIIIVVAAFNIISGLIMLVKDKGREIGILRTMGATQGAIMRVFLITGASIGVVGTLAGALLGIVFCWKIDEIRHLVARLTNTNLFDPSIYYLSKLPADINARTTAIIVGMALVLSVRATLYPSWRASRLDPVEALRYE